ncbi:hypothetical protein [Aequoribacter sp.]|uniref:hypothetical protein n=1 Tax=Aequoribacter sp. TaxID=2847771 RepID=UPI003F6A46D3
MATVLVKKTATHKIYKRKDGRYAVTTLKGAAVNGDDKAAVLLAEGLIQLSQPAPAEPEVEEAPAEEAAAEEAPAEEAQAEEAQAEEAQAEEETKDAE